ncbi:malectin isoform X2 [Myxocyprinus asiaticus]|uniref:malectin isoform X2 n=1 Tax=Myxocyprinus asiaticus TaxID=70543 RepID=UPI002221BCD3|nr:malectin isoform X2 [Myxocyprinus asiaticus]
MRRVTVHCVARLLLAALWLLVEECRAESGAPSLAERVIWAVNAGGDAHTDVHGIHYKKDPLEGKLGKASDYGVRLPILRSSPEDQILYQTERYNEDTFGYEVPIREEGDYILVMKYAEVYFAQSQQKVFDVRLNGHVVVKDLDIFDRVGHSTAHDEIVPFSIKRGKLSVHGEVSTFNGKLTVEFVKMFQNYSHILGWRRERRMRRKKMRLRLEKAKRRVPPPLPRILFGPVHAPPTHMLLITAA